MKRFTILFGFFFISAFSAGAQKLANHGLVVTGSVQKVVAKCEERKPLFSVIVSVQIRNDNQVPVILVGGWGITSTKFSFVSTKPGSTDETVVNADVVKYNPFQDDPFGPPTKNDYDPYSSHIKHPERWEAPEPIPPGGYFEMPLHIWLTSGFKLSAKSTEAFKECRPVSETPVPDYASFYLEYRTSLKNYENGEGVMRLLQERWKSIGHLPLDTNGDLSYRSETIVFPSP